MRTSFAPSAPITDQGQRPARPISALQSVGLFVLLLDRTVRVGAGIVQLPGLLSPSQVIATLNALLPTRASFEHLLNGQHEAERQPGGNYLFTLHGWVVLGGGSGPVEASAQQTAERTSIHGAQRGWERMKAAEQQAQDQQQPTMGLVAAVTGYVAPAMAGFGFSNASDTPADLAPVAQGGGWNSLATEGAALTACDPDYMVPEHNERSLYNMTMSHVFDADRDSLREQLDQCQNDEQVRALIDYVASEIKHRPRLHPKGRRR